MRSHRVTLYTKAGCCLCDDAKAALAEARRAVEFDLAEIDIESDAALYEKHKHDIPVIEVDGHRAFKHRVAPAQLVERLRR